MNVQYKAGDVIMESYPFVKVLLETDREIRCNNCFKWREQLQPCPTCAVYHYCDLDCQNEDWNKGHAVECKSDCFRQHCCKGSQMDVKRLLFRMYAYLKLEPDAANRPFQLHNGKTRCFNDMLSHQEIMAKNKESVAECQAIAEGIKAEDPESNVTTEELLRLLGIHRTNSFSVSNEEDTTFIGWAVYVEPSVFDHSCKPTALFQTVGLKLQVRAIYPVLECEQPLISYLSKHMDITERQKDLKEHYNFTCRCIKCEVGYEFGVDYEKLLFLIDRMQKRESGLLPEIAWAEVNIMHRDIIRMLRLIYYEYDDRITAQFAMLLNIALKMDVEEKELKHLFTETFIHTQISHGKEHQFYLALQKDYARVFP